MLTGSASKEEQRAILQRLAQNPKAGRRTSAMDEGGEKEIKLVYVTVGIVTPQLAVQSILTNGYSQRRLQRARLSWQRCRRWPTTERLHALS
jgi:hypothetical protein